MPRGQYTDRPHDLTEFESRHGPLDRQIAAASSYRRLCALLLVKGGLSDEAVFEELVRRFGDGNGRLRKETGLELDVRVVNHIRNRLRQGKFRDIGRIDLQPVAGVARPTRRRSQRAPGARVRGAAAPKSPGPCHVAREEVDECLRALLDELRSVGEDLATRTQAAMQARDFAEARGTVAAAEAVAELTGIVADVEERWKGLGARRRRAIGG